MQRNVRLERVYPHPPERVWKALTDPKAISDWLMETDFQPYVGHRFQFRTHSSIGFDGIVNCEVITVDKPKKLAYTWQGGPMKKPTTVTWNLFPIEGGTRLELEHTGFEGLVGIGLSFILGRGWAKALREMLPPILLTLAQDSSTGERVTQHNLDDERHKRMSQRILTLHPEGKEGVNIEQAKYDEMKGAILDIIEKRGEMPFGELADEVGKQLPNFEGSIGWYTTSVKLDLEARGLIQRVPKSSPQRLVLSK